MEFSIAQIVFIFWISLILWILIEFLYSRKHKNNNVEFHKSVGNDDKNM